MTTVAQISGAVRRLPKRDLAKFRKWFVEYDAAAWDQQFAEDVADGRLDRLAREALKELRTGRTTDEATQNRCEMKIAEGDPGSSRVAPSQKHTL